MIRVLNHMAHAGLMCPDLLGNGLYRGARVVNGSRTLCLRWLHFVERMHCRFAGLGKLRIRFERPLKTRQALLSLAAATICSRFSERSY